MKRLITSALPYVNNIPHLGNIIGSVLSADVFSRFSKSKGYKVLFICGTDEYGTATETAAKELNITPQELCDNNHEIHKKIYEDFNIEFDIFGRTTNSKHRETVQEIFLDLYNNSYITEEEVEQLYCKHDKIFLADRYVQGICPYCSYEKAKGDQCDKCGKILNPTELINPKCKLCGNTPVIKKTKQLFIELPKFSNSLKEFLEQRKNNFSQNAVRITEAWLKEGLKNRSITRDLEWGIPVPLEGYKNKVFYVWFDAPIGYISITRSHKDDWRDWWLSSDVSLYQFMGKDNVPFHTIIFPAVLIGTKKPYTLVQYLNATEYLTYEGEKFSKSNKIGIFGNQIKETNIDVDVFRYYLLINRPEKADTDFSWSDLQTKNNNELVANLGNLVNRTLTFLNRYFNRKAKQEIKSEEAKTFWDIIIKEEKKVEDLFEKIELKEALKRIMHISSLGNKFFQDNQPWKTIKTNDEYTWEVISLLSNLVKDLAIMIYPFMPNTSKKIFSKLNLEFANQWDFLGKLLVDNIKEGPYILFRKIEDEEIIGLREKFSTKKDKVFNADLRVAKIIEVNDIKDSKKLYLLKIDLGKEKRQLVAGLKTFFKPEELLNRKIVVVYNLKPAKLMGYESQGMLLAAQKDKDLVLLDPKDIEVGAQIKPRGHLVNEKIIDIKEFLKLKLTIKSKRLVYNNEILKDEHNKSVIASIADGAEVR